MRTTTLFFRGLPVPGHVHRAELPLHTPGLARIDTLPGFGALPASSLQAGA